jgi:hypothetical protein
MTIIGTPASMDSSGSLRFPQHSRRQRVTLRPLKVSGKRAYMSLLDYSQAADAATLSRSNSG